MKRGKFFSGIKRVCTAVSLCIIVFALGYGAGIRQNIKDVMLDVREKAVSAKTENGGYSAILSGKWIYVYDEKGALFDTVYVYTEYMTEEDKAALSHGVEFENEEEMRAFIDTFE